jgi:hypothetical protein
VVGNVEVDIVVVVVVDVVDVVVVDDDIMLLMLLLLLMTESISSIGLHGGCWTTERDKDVRAGLVAEAAKSVVGFAAEVTDVATVVARAVVDDFLEGGL